MKWFELSEWVAKRDSNRVSRQSWCTTQCLRLCVTYFRRSSLYLALSSSNSFWFMSMNSFKALYTSPWIVLHANAFSKYTSVQSHQDRHTRVQSTTTLLTELNWTSDCHLLLSSAVKRTAKKKPTEALRINLKSSPNATVTIRFCSLPPAFKITLTIVHNQTLFYSAWKSFPQIRTHALHKQSCFSTSST